MGPGQLTFDGMPDPSFLTQRSGHRHRKAPKPRRPPSPIRAVLEFHRALGLPIRCCPTSNVPEQERDLRVRLIREETEELSSAVAEGDLVAVADALADIVYVTYGTALHYGIDLDAAIAEIHRSNMTKLGPDGRALVRADGKVLKGPSYQEPDIARLLGMSHEGRFQVSPLQAEPLPGFRVTARDESIQE